MDSIQISFDIRAYNEAAISARTLTQHRAGWWRSISFFLIPFGSALVLGTFAGQGILGQSWFAAALVAGYAAIGSFFASLLLGLRHRKGVARLMRDSPSRALPYTVFLSAEGVIFSGRHYPWSVFPSVTTLPGMTVLQFSPLEGVIMPDKELPAGLTPEMLRSRIEAWRKGATVDG